MTTTKGDTIPTTSNRAIEHFREAILSGRNWYIALLEAIGLWTEAEETHNGRHYRYLIDGEAFDWLLLAERLCQAMDGLLPEEEKTSLLFCGRPPVELPADDFERLIGPAKHRQHLNYFYGIIIEEALLLAVQDEVRKESTLAGSGEETISRETFRRIYDADQNELLNRFRQQKGYPQSDSIGLPEQKEFTYWLFKHRLASSDKARVASDTKKALRYYNAARGL